MLFEDLQTALLQSVRERVRNGELTERNLAKLTGISQPHIHNVLKGARVLSPEIADQLLRQLNLSVLDLVDPTRIALHLQSGPSEFDRYSYARVLGGRLGPKNPWPERIGPAERLQISPARLGQMVHPVGVRLAVDTRMRGIVNEDELILLDQSSNARRKIQPDACYVIKRGDEGVVRWLRIVGRSLYVLAQDNLERPAYWERYSLDTHDLDQIVRAKVNFLPRDFQWSC